MSFDEVKKISIQSYLHSIGYKPIEKKASYAMFLSPYRRDTQASLKVDFNRNIWCDFGTGEGGSIIDLVMKIKNCSFTDAVTELKQQSNRYSFSFHREERTVLIQPKPIIIKTKDIGNNKALDKYIISRGINLTIAKKYCIEIYYSVGCKRYFSIGFQNRSQGYELRNPYFKNCIGKKDITFVSDGDSDVLCAFEGFFDFLSYMQIISDQVNQSCTNCLILNSLTLVDQAKVHFDQFEYVNLFLDNDESGKRVTHNLLNSFPKVRDCSNLYSGYKDLNEYHIYRVERS